ncbi:MAG: hypothetical protein KJ941_01815 [Bacteroidetes bacterium]|nr:hypothetical protein [Bacteroidota bacterium]
MWDDLIQLNQEFSLDFLKSKMVLWIWNPHQKPPHIGLSIDKKYFSLRFNKLEHSVEIEHVTKKVTRSQIPLILIELNLTRSEKFIENTFSKYKSCYENECSCLLPILQSLKVEEEKFLLRDLLKLLQERNNIVRKFSINLPHHWSDIPVYSSQDVQENWKNIYKNAEVDYTAG